MDSPANDTCDPDFSIVVPCYNEAMSLRQLTKEVSLVLDSLDITWELLLIDDGSTDNTLEVIHGLAEQNPHVRALGLSRNFGKESAMLAGLQLSGGTHVLIMDADLQHPPSLIPTMYALANEGWDQVIALRNRQRESFVRRGLARLFYRTVNVLIDVKLIDGAGDFRILSRRCVNELLRLHETHRFSKGLFAWIGFSQVTVHFEHIEGTREDSSWSFASLLNYAIDGVLSFNVKPLRTAIWLGLSGVGATTLYFLWLLTSALIWGINTPGYLTTIGIVVLLGGMQLLTLGVIGEYVGRIFNETKRRPLYLLAYDSRGSRTQSDLGVRSPSTHAAIALDDRAKPR